MKGGEAGLTSLSTHGTMQRYYGGVEVPVGLTVFKTAEGSLSAAPGGFDSHTPLLRPKHKTDNCSNSSTVLKLRTTRTLFGCS